MMPVMVTKSDDGYPTWLRECPQAPAVLYVQGTLLPEDEAAVAVVGTRTPSYYGVAMAEQLAGDLARSGLTIISGLARGIDSIAHQAALKAGGRTIAVLGCGLAQIYPPEHAALAEAIARQGAVISEFPMEASPLARHFPWRNRLISWLSLGVLVVEASERSGSLITAEWAAEHNRLVFALPGNVLSGSARGTHGLIRDGAILVESAEHILEALAPQLEAILGRLPAAPRERSVAAQAGPAAKPLDESEAFRHAKRSGAGVLARVIKRCR